MKFATLLLFAITGFAPGQDADPQVPPPVPRVTANGEATPWLGLSVGRLDDTVRAQVPDLPTGIGFVVTAVEPGSPADKGGVKRYDLLWKMDDQWIANEGQLLTLLRLRKEGQEATLGIYRSGKALALPVVLGRIPDNLVQGPLAADAEKGGEAVRDMPMKVVDGNRRTAEIEAPDGKALLTRVGGVSTVRIVSKDGTVIYDGPLNDIKGVSLVPGPWKIRVGALVRSLDHASKESPAPRPRLRVATAPAVEEPAGK